MNEHNTGAKTAKIGARLAVATEYRELILTPALHFL